MIRSKLFQFFGIASLVLVSFSAASKNNRGKRGGNKQGGNSNKNGSNAGPSKQSDAHNVYASIYYLWSVGNVQSDVAIPLATNQVDPMEIDKHSAVGANIEASLVDSISSLSLTDGPVEGLNSSVEAQQAEPQALLLEAKEDSKNMAPLVAADGVIQSREIENWVHVSQPIPIAQAHGIFKKPTELPSNSGMVMIFHESKTAKDFEAMEARSIDEYQDLMSISIKLPEDTIKRNWHLLVVNWAEYPHAHGTMASCKDGNCIIEVIYKNSISMTEVIKDFTDRFKMYRKESEPERLVLELDWSIRRNNLKTVVKKNSWECKTSWSLRIPTMDQKLSTSVLSSVLFDDEMYQVTLSLLRDLEYLKSQRLFFLAPGTDYLKGDNWERIVVTYPLKQLKAILPELIQGLVYMHQKWFSKELCGFSLHQPKDKQPYITFFFEETNEEVEKRLSAFLAKMTSFKIPFELVSESLIEANQSLAPIYSLTTIDMNDNNVEPEQIVWRVGDSSVTSDAELLKNLKPEHTMVFATAENYNHLAAISEEQETTGYHAVFVDCWMDDAIALAKQAISMANSGEKPGFDIFVALVMIVPKVIEEEAATLALVFKTRSSTSDSQRKFQNFLQKNATVKNNKDLVPEIVENYKLSETFEK